MQSRKEAVLNMQLMLIPILKNAWKTSLERLSDIFNEYDILGYIDVAYEAFNSTGEQGIIKELEEYIEMQGGSIK